MMPNTCAALIHHVFIQTKTETHKVSFSQSGSVTANIHTDVRYLSNTFLSGVKRSSAKGKQTNTASKSVSMSKTPDNTVTSKTHHTVGVHEMREKYLRSLKDLISLLWVRV